MKICKKCLLPKDLSEFGKDAYHRTYGAKDGKNIYCRQCCREKIYERRAMLRNGAPAKSVGRPKVPQPPPQEASAQLKLFVKNQIRLLTKNGASRELIKRETKAPMDIVVDVLAELWDKGEVFTRKHGEERYFYLKRAA